MTDRYWKGAEFVKKGKLKRDVKLGRINNMTVPRSAGRGQKVPRSYVNRGASNVAELPIWLGKCHRKFFEADEARRTGQRNCKIRNISLVLQYVLDLT